jgi:hypothetical protein
VFPAIIQANTGINSRYFTACRAVYVVMTTPLLSQNVSFGGAAHRFSEPVRSSPEVLRTGFPTRERCRLFVLFREVPKVSPRRPDTGALFAFRLIMEDRKRVVFADSPEDLARVICTPFGYPNPGLAPDMVTFELMASARRKYAVGLANQTQALVLASAQEAELPLPARRMSSWMREAIFLDRAEVPRHPILVWPRRDVPLILVASSYSPVTDRARTLGATWIDDLDDESLIETAGAILGWRLDRSPQKPAGEGTGNVSGRESP